MKQILIIFLLSFFTLTSDEIPDSTAVDINSQLEKFKTLMNFSFVYHVDSIDVNEKAEEALKAYMQALDPKSYYFPAEKYKSLKEANTGKKYSTGITQVVIGGHSYIFQIDKGSSADSSEIKPGFEIISIQGDTVLGKSEVDINNMLSDTNKKDIELTLRTLEKDTVSRKVRIGEIPSYSVNSYFMVNDSVGYIRSLKFSEKADEEFEKAISELKKDGLKSLIIDLRDNPGGVLNQIVEIISTFVKDSTLIINTKSKHPDYHYEMYAEGDGENIGIPVVLIVNDNTASACELFAGAVQDYDLGLIVGERTYGKGTLQKYWEFKDGSAFRVTVGEYVTPLGRQVQKSDKKSKISDDVKLNVKNPEILKRLENLDIPSKVDVVKSTKGRSLLSIGGIMPDITSKTDTLTLLTKVMQRKRIILETVIEIFYSEADKIKNKYQDFLSYAKGFRFNDNVYKILEGNSRDKNTWNDKMFKKDKLKMASLIKARLGQMIYGEPAFYCVYLETDNVFEDALSSVDEANKLVNQ